MPSSSRMATNEDTRKAPLLLSPSCWPSVFDEGYEMILAAIMIYGIVDLRSLARKGLVDDQILKLPISARDIANLVMKNKPVIHQHVGEDAAVLYLDAFDSISEDEENGLELGYDLQTGEASFVPFDVVAVGDENSASQLVYGICVHHARRRITVIFRGCTTTTDWTVCATSYLTEYPNPLLEQKEMKKLNTEQPDTVAIHSGFYRYLLDSSSTSHKTKFQEILDILDELLEEHPEYDVYVTGHSLGGALATVFAFQAAATASAMLGPVTCIPIASPMVGNLSLEQAFMELEYQGRIRCLRITNHFDIFTQLPDRATYLYAFAWCFGWTMVYYFSWSCLFFLCCQDRVYRHVGMDLHLYKRQGYKIKHSKGSSNNFIWRVAQDWKKHMKQTIQRMITVPFVCFCDFCFCKENFNKNHTIEEHLHRLKAMSSDLENLHLNELYEERRFVA